MTQSLKPFAYGVDYIETVASKSLNFLNNEVA